VTGRQSRREWQKKPLSLAGKKLMPFDRNKNDKSTATKPDVLHVANIKPDTVKDRGFW
jgi:hypothetical protein